MPSSILSFWSSFSGFYFFKRKSSKTSNVWLSYPQVHQKVKRSLKTKPNTCDPKNVYTKKCKFFHIGCAFWNLSVIYFFDKWGQLMLQNLFLLSVTPPVIMKLKCPFALTDRKSNPCPRKLLIEIKSEKEKKTFLLTKNPFKIWAQKIPANHHHPRTVHSDPFLEKIPQECLKVSPSIKRVHCASSFLSRKTATMYYYNFYCK